MFVSGLRIFGQGGGQGREARAKFPEAPAIGFFGSYRVAADKMDPSKLPIIGAWRINFDRSDPANKAQGRFKETGTAIYSAVNGGIKQEVFLFYPPKNDSYKNTFTDDGREFFWKLDGKNIYENPQGPNGLGANGGHVARRSQYHVPRTRHQRSDRRAGALSRQPGREDARLRTTFNSGGDSGHVVWDRLPMSAVGR